LRIQDNSSRLAFVGCKLYTFTLIHSTVLVSSQFVLLLPVVGWARLWGFEPLRKGCAKTAQAVKLNNEGVPLRGIAPFVFVKQMVFMFNH
jgi:hypothetical protein